MPSRVLEGAPVYVVGALWAALLGACLVLVTGCGDNIECPPVEAPAVPPPCVPAAGAALNLCGYEQAVAGVALPYQVAGCRGFVANAGCTVPVDLAQPDANGRTLVDAICVERCLPGAP